jgi:hypothetical protein
MTDKKSISPAGFRLIHEGSSLVRRGIEQYRTALAASRKEFLAARTPRALVTTAISRSPVRHTSSFNLLEHLTRATVATRCQAYRLFRPGRSEIGASGHYNFCSGLDRHVAFRAVNGPS